MSRQILLFGAGGMVGQEIAELARSEGFDLAAPPHQEIDICDPTSVKAALLAYKPEFAINAAAYTAVDRAESERERAFEVNSDGPCNLALAAKEFGASLIHLSTDYVFDGRKIGAYLETDRTDPLSAYGSSKDEGERRIREVLPNHVILRTAWVYGVSGNNFLKTVMRLSSERNELRIVADQFGRPTSAADIAQAVMRVSKAIINSCAAWGTFHFTGSGAVTSWHGFAQHVVNEQAKITGKRPVVRPIATAEYPTLARRPANSVMDCSLFQEAYGYRAPDWTVRATETVRRLLCDDGPRSQALHEV